MRPIALCLLLCLAAPVEAQERATSISSSLERKQATATRVPDGAIHLDGVPDEDVWGTAVPIVDFVQKEPNEGVPPSEETEVRIVYDGSALYIAARMHDSRHAGIQAPLGRRDDVEAQAEYILVALDTYQDRLTAYGFGVSATGVRLDRTFRQDNETNVDEGFDPVWQARTHVGVDEWTAELWIPFSQLRFNEREEQVWGMNIQRFTPTLDEMDYWVQIPRTERGWASRFGDLRGIEGIRPTRRIEVLPYLAGASTINGNRDRDNPFDDGRNLNGRVGGDLKMGLGPSLTLEATVNPDFGQVEADAAEVNLTAVETTLTEKRPFFAEGAPLLNPSQANSFFYSRRIGARPTVSVAGDFVHYPSTANIIASAKLTGRLRSGTSIGVLGALTDDEAAQVSSRGSSAITDVRVVPRTTYGLVRVQQEFGRSASTVSGMITAVHRDIDAVDPLSALMVHHAFSGLADSIVRLKDGQYQLRSYAGFGYVSGEPAAIARLQRQPLHSFQRPDKDYAFFDPTRTSMLGYRIGGDIERTGGRHWLWNVLTDWESPGFETNDMGRLGSTDGIKLNSSVRYRETVPGRLFRAYSIGVAQTNEWNYGGNRQVGGARADVNLTLLNFWTATLSTGRDFRTMSARLTRGGPLMATPGAWTTIGTLRSRSSAQAVWNLGFTATTDEAGGGITNVNGGVSFRPGTRWQLSVTPKYIQETNSQQYITTVAGGRPETYGQRYVFAYIDRTTLSTQFRLGYTLRPDVTVDVYAEPFAASGRYYDVGELPAPQARELRVYGTDGTTVAVEPNGSRTVTDGAQTFVIKNQDFNVRSFRSNLVLRWEWRPGSTLFVVWQQDRRGEVGTGEHVGAGDLLGAFDHPGSNFFVVKTSFWIPVG